MKRRLAVLRDDVERQLLAFVISCLLLVVAAVLIVRRDLEGLTGAIVGYIAGYWLPNTNAEVTDG